MSEFKVGDKVQANEDITANCGTVLIARKGDVGEVVNIYEELPFYGGNMFVAKFGDKQVLTGSISVDKYEVKKLETPEPVKPKFSVGDKVRIVKKEGKSNWYAHVYDGVEGEIRCIFEDGQVFVKTQVQDGISFSIPTEFVEKLEPQNTETPKNEKKLERITITLKNRQSAIVIIGNYLSADAEFVYYESRDGKTYEIREDEIIMIVSEEIEQ